MRPLSLKKRIKYRPRRPLASGCRRPRRPLASGRREPYLSPLTESKPAASPQRLAVRVSLKAAGRLHEPMEEPDGSPEAPEKGKRARGVRAL